MTQRTATLDDIGRIIWHAFVANHGYRITAVSANGRLVFGLPVKKMATSLPPTRTRLRVNWKRRR